MSAWTRDSVTITRPVGTITAGKQIGGAPTSVATAFLCLLELQQAMTVRVRAAGSIEREGYLMSWRQTTPAVHVNDLVTDNATGKKFMVGKVQYDNIGRFSMAELKGQV